MMPSVASVRSADSAKVMVPDRPPSVGSFSSHVIVTVLSAIAPPLLLVTCYCASHAEAPAPLSFEQLAAVHADGHLDVEAGVAFTEARTARAVPVVLALRSPEP